MYEITLKIKILYLKKWFDYLFSILFSIYCINLKHTTPSLKL